MLSNFVGAKGFLVGCRYFHALGVGPPKVIAYQVGAHPPSRDRSFSNLPGVGQCFYIMGIQD